MKLPRVRFTMYWLMVAVGLSGLTLGIYVWMVRRAEAQRVEAANRAIARRQLALIDDAWSFLEMMSSNSRIEIDGGTIGPWGRRRLEALRKAGAGKTEIVAALEKYVNDLERFQRIAEVKRHLLPALYEEYEIKYLRMEAELWLNEEKSR